MLEKEKVSIGFIGTGVMGTGMALNLLKAGYKLNVYTRTKEKANEVIEQGASWKETVADLAKDSDVIITIVGYPKDVEEVYLGSEGILNHIKPESYIIDMTTSSPKLAQKIEAKAKEKNVHSFDAPVSGGDIGARNAKLTIMVGGNKEKFRDIKPIFDTLGTNVVLQGEAGAGQHTKMCNQIAIASTMMGVSEALAYAQKAGLDHSNVLKSIESGAAGSWSLSNLAPRVLKGDYTPGFYVKHFIKDMKIAIESAEEMGLETPGLNLAKKLYDQLAETGEENSGTQALYKLYM